MPNDLAFALSVNTADMRPWEFWESDSAELYMINALKNAYDEGREDAKAQMQPEPSEAEAR